MIKSFWYWFKSLFTGDSEPQPAPIPKPTPDDTIGREPEPVESDFTPEKYRYNQRLWNTMQIKLIGKQKRSNITWTINRLKRNQDRYEKACELVYRKTEKLVPWQALAAMHMREASGNFSKQVLNGQSWKKRTTWVPKGYGPWDSWEESCVTAFKIKNTPNIWNMEDTLHFLERFNGLGYAMYRSHIVGYSPYVWAYTDHYKGGYYVADGKFDRYAVAMGVGCAVILKELGFKGE